MKILINEDGITGRQQNPYFKSNDRLNNTSYKLFEATVKSYTVIGSGFKAGDVVECDLVWQQKLPTTSCWININQEPLPISKQRYDARQAYLMVEAHPESKHVFDEGDPYEVIGNPDIIFSVEKRLQTFYVLYYYPPYKTGWTKTYTTELEAVSESIARNVFRQNYPNAIIKGIEDYPPA